jgi:hypothetical protein
LAIGARAGETSELLEPGAIDDYSVLFGLRRPSDWTTLVGAIGVGASTATFGEFHERLATVGVLTYDVEGAMSARYGGLGLSVFGALGPASRSYTGIGVTLELGKIH